MPNQDPYLSQQLLSHQTFLKRLAIELVGKDADDLVQDVWQRALERPPHHGHQLRGWLARVARNLAANRWRGEARRTEREQRRARERPMEVDLEARFELRKELVEALDSLSNPSRETILLRYFEGLAPSDIATRQGLPVATVKTRLRRGLGQLREALDKRYGDDRATWMSAVAALAVPVGGSVETGTLTIGAIAMGTMMKVSAAVLVAAACVYFVVRAPQAEPPRIAAIEPEAADVELEADSVVTKVGGVGAEVVGRSLVANEPRAEASAVTGRRVLRVVLEGLTEEDAPMTRVTLKGVDKRFEEWPSHVQDSWMCQGLTSEFDLAPFFARVAGATGWDLHVDELELKVYHPQHLIETVRVPLSRGVKQEDGQTVYAARVRLVPGAPYVFWPELTLTVRDQHTRTHLKDVELRFVPTAFMGLWQVPGTDVVFTSLGSGLSSPIALLGGREPDEQAGVVAGLALGPAAGAAPQLIELVQPEEAARGVVVYARAPGYAWGKIVLDVSTGAKRELLLEPAGALDVRMTNVQLDRYAALETEFMLSVDRLDAAGDEQRAWSQRLDETLVSEGLQLESLEPGEYVVSVQTSAREKQTELLAREELTLAAGETRLLKLALADPSAPRERAALGGLISFPDFGGEQQVRLQFYGTDYRYGEADIELSLADMERIGDAPPTWSFHLEDVPVGRYQVQLVPFLKSWVIELPVGGATDVEFVIPELAEVLVETVDAGTGERIPLEQIRYGYREDLPGQVHQDWSAAQLLAVGFEGEPGRFHFWTAPGAAFVQTYGIPSGLDYGQRKADLELVPGLQTVRFELEPVYAIRFEFRVNGAPLPQDDGIFQGLSRGIRAVGHEGRVHAVTYWLFEASAPGLYEISFEGIGADRFLPTAPRLVDVRAGETAEVIVELRRK